MTRSCRPPHSPEVLFAKADDTGAAGELCAQGHLGCAGRVRLLGAAGCPCVPMWVFFCVFGSCRKCQALCVQGLSCALQWAVGGSVADSPPRGCARAKCMHLILKLNPSQVFLSPWPQRSVATSSAAGVKWSLAALHRSPWLLCATGLWYLWLGG